ncbi:MAG: peptidase M22 [Ruminococcus sp.]|nr:peptidase M22 [Ruminococcus sp.]
MSKFLGIDTSNYTTSVCLYDDISDTVVQKRKLLPVTKGELGLRQSDAVFHHTQQLPVLIEELFRECKCDVSEIKAVGASFSPRKMQGSYMPCFTVGSCVARILGSTLNIPIYELSHQQGHIAAALYSTKRLDLLKKRFLAFHVSGGTTDALLVNDSNSDDILPVKLVGKTLDLNAGQLVDRVGLMLSCNFPCGKELEQLALQCDSIVKAKPTIKGTDCCLSGVENICEKALKDENSKSYVAALCLKYIEESLFKMTENILGIYGDMPVIFAGGVMSNYIIRNNLTNKLSCTFCEPQFSTDNACGIAVLTSILSSKSEL